MSKLPFFIGTIVMLFWSQYSLMAEQITLRVMTFNIWVGGAAGKQPLKQTTEAIIKARADIVGMQETMHGKSDSSKIIADSLGWYHFAQGGNTSILSRYPIKEHTPNRWGTAIELNEETQIYFFNVHFRPSPYQPYQLKKIPYGNAPFIKTAEEAIEWASKARGDQVDRMLSEVNPAIKTGSPVFVTGDFNEPSFQDWTSAAAKQKIVPLPVQYPATLKVTQAGLIDTFRKVHPDEITNRGYTWTNKTKPNDPKDFHDRIDFVFCSGAKIIKSEVVGENDRNADIVLSPWPSDHRAVVSTVMIQRPKKKDQIKPTK
ncbi:MAG: endonuclease/exonuclease/phosphatase family protein [Verrucomicrobiota bacterium]|nr:endonuclease/exonuclease/phosphatase family protein [Verrucomicrobiota bacterium]